MSKTTSQHEARTHGAIRGTHTHVAYWISADHQGEMMMGLGDSEGAAIDDAERGLAVQRIEREDGDRVYAQPIAWEVSVAQIDETTWRVTHPDPIESYSVRDAADILLDAGVTTGGDVAVWLGSDLYRVERA